MLKRMKQLTLTFLIVVILLACRTIPDNSVFVSPLPAQTPSVEDITPTQPISLADTPATIPNSRPEELLLVWGRESAFAGDCHLLILNPTTQQQLEFINQGQDCNYGVVTVHGKQHLTSYPSFLPIDDRPHMELALYDLTVEGELKIQQKFVLDNIRVSYPPQWSENGFIYLSGIRDGREQIYLFNIQTETLVPYIDAFGGFSTLPSLSPDHRYLAYRVVANHQSQDECGGLTCFKISYHIWDTVTETDIAFLPLVEPFIWGEPYFMHCDLTWSPTGRFIAFDVGCGLQRPSSIVIFDVIKQELVEVINSQEDLTKSGWVSEDEIIIRGKMSFALSEGADDGYIIYSANDQDWYNLSDLSAFQNYDLDKIFYQDWTDEGMVLVGTSLMSIEAAEQVPVLVIIDPISHLELQVSFSNERIENPTWSLNGNLIVYRSYDWDTRHEKSRFVVITRTGETLLDTGMLNIFSPKFSWFQQNP
jgi:hypothetical protein